MFRRNNTRCDGPRARRGAKTVAAVALVAWAGLGSVAGADDHQGDSGVAIGEVDGTTVAVVAPPVPPANDVVAVGEPPVPPAKEIVAVGEPPVPPATLDVDGDPAEPPKSSDPAVITRPPAPQPAPAPAPAPAVAAAAPVAPPVVVVEVAPAIVDLAGTVADALSLG